MTVFWPFLNKATLTKCHAKFDRLIDKNKVFFSIRQDYSRIELGLEILLNSKM